MSDDEDEPTVIGQQAIPPTRAVRGVTDDDLAHADTLPKTIHSSKDLRPQPGPTALDHPARPLTVSPPTKSPHDTAQEAMDLSSIQDPKKTWKAVIGIVTALSTGGVAVSQSGLMKVSFGTPSSPAGETRLCAPPEHCPTALEVQSLRDRLKGEGEGRRRITSRLEDVEDRQKIVINKVDDATMSLGRVQRALEALKDVVQNLNMDARNRNIATEDVLKGLLKKMDDDLHELAEDVEYIKKKVKRR